MLAEYFLPQQRGPAESQTPKALPGGLTPEQQDAVKALVRERLEALPKNRQGSAKRRCWSSIKAKVAVLIFTHKCAKASSYSPGAGIQRHGW